MLVKLDFVNAHFSTFIKDKATGEALSFPNIRNINSGIAVEGNKYGFVSINASLGDSLSIVGYKTQNIKFDKKNDLNSVVYLDSQELNLEELTVKGRLNNIFDKDLPSKID